jgi:hypothetical protein
MSSEAIISILLSIPIGIISGLYSGLIVTRYARFAQSRDELLRIVRKIQFVRADNSVRIWNDEDVPNIVFIQSELYFLKHREAGRSVGQLCSEIMATNRRAKSGQINFDEYSERHGGWQNQGRNLRPRMQTIISLWPKL